MAKKKKGSLRRRSLGRELPNYRWEQFCNLFVFGNPKHDKTKPKGDRDNPPETRHNQTISYMEAGYKAGYDSARVSAHWLLKNPNIIARIAELRKEEQNIKNAFMEHWKSMLPDAQEILRQSLAGEDVTSAQIQAAKEVIEQAVGPTRFRFGIDKGPDTDGAVNITLWRGKKE